jgi:predicted exporter
VNNKFPLLVLAAALIGAAFVIAHTRITADFSAFLPTAPTPTQQLLVDQLQNGVVSRLILIGIDGGSANARSAASRQIAATLRANSDFVAVNNGEPITQQRDQQFLFEHRYILSSAIAPERFSVNGLRVAIGDSIDMLASATGLLIKGWVERDPTGEVMQLLEQFNSNQAPLKQGGVWVSRAGQRALLVAQTTASGADTDAQQRALSAIARAFATVRTNTPAVEKNLQLQMTGPGVFAVQARESIRTQAEYLATFSLILTSGFLLLVYRSWRLLALGLLPVAAGIAVSVAAVSLWFGSVHGLTLAFGTTLIGEAVDYAIYFFVQTQRTDHASWRREFWPTIRLGVIISVCGFATLMFSGFPGLAQLGLYSIVGLITAALTARFVLPAVAPVTAAAPIAMALGNRLLTLLARRRPWWRMLAAALALIAVIIVVRHGDALWDESLTALSPVPVTAQAADAQLRADLGAPDVRYMLAISGRDKETVLRSAERASAVLQRLVDADVIAGFDSASRYLPSVAMQKSRQAALPDTDILINRLPQALRDLPLSAEKLQGFIDAVSAAKRGKTLERGDLDTTSFALAVDSLLVERNGEWHAVLPLQAKSNADIPAAQIRAALLADGIDDAVLVDIKSETEALYASYFREILHLSLAGFAAIVLVLALSLRSLRHTVAVLVPLAVAVAMVMATCVMLEQRLNLLHLIGLFLIVAVGSNYALFFARGQLQAQTVASLLVANVTTVIGFGLLAFSTVPVLQAIGTTVGPGAVLALIFSALWSASAQQQALPASQR